MSTTQTQRLTPDSVVSASRGQISSELAGEVVILNLSAGVYHGLDATGARIWQLIQQPRTIADIHQTLVNEYDVESDRCARDLMELLENLSANGLLQIHAGPAH